MTALKKRIAYTFLFTFVCTATIGLLGALRVITLTDTALTSIFAFLIAQCVAVITAIVKAPGYFDDPPAAAKLKQTFESEIFQLKQAYTGQVKQLNQAHAQTTSSHLQRQKADEEKIHKLQAETLRMRKELAALPRSVRPMGQVVSVAATKPGPA
jgi:hypothetical protein